MSQKLIAHNAEVLEGLILAREFSLKGTAPSFYNRESDVPPPGPSVLLTGKGMDALDAHMEARRKGTAIDAMLLEADRAIAHVRREHFPHWYAMLRSQNDPGVVQRGKDPRASESDVVVRSLFLAGCLKAAEYLERINPGARLWRPGLRPKEEEPVDAPKAGSWKRGDVLQRKRWEWEDSARKVGEEVREIMRLEDCSAEAAKGLLVQRKQLGPGEVDKKWRFCRSEEKDGAA